MIKNSCKKWSRKRKQKLKERLAHKNEVRETPMIEAQNINYELSKKIKAICNGGIGAVHTFVRKLGLDKMLDEKISLLKVHKPYHDSDHILNMVYSIICGGTCLDDIERLRNDPAYLDALEVERIPDSTTAGDYLRRFGLDDVLALMEVMVRINQLMWALDPSNGEREAILDIDGIVKQTYGECKEKTDYSYKKVWGHMVQVITEAVTGTHLYVVPHGGNEASQKDAAFWINKAIEAVRSHFLSVCLRGDSAFALTKNFDAWNSAGVRFIFAYKAMSNLVEMAENLPESAWTPDMEREALEKSRKRKRKKNHKAEAIRKRGFENLERERESIAEFDYTPENCQESYRVVVIRRIIRVKKGYLPLPDEVRYFFYITNIRTMTALEVVQFYRGRANHENKLEQLKNGVNALKMPCTELNANWAYMVTGAMAWNLKAWLGQVIQDREFGEKITRMEFKRFRNCLINIPCQIINSGRTITYRILGWTPWVDNFLNTFRDIKQLKFSH